MLMNSKAIKSNINKLKGYLETENSIQQEYVAMVMFNLLFKLNTTKDILDEHVIPISEEDLKLVLKCCRRKELRFRNYKLIMILISVAVVVVSFFLQYLVVNAGFVLSITVSLLIGVGEYMFIKKGLIPKYSRKEENEIIKNINPKIIRLCTSLSYI